MLSRAQKFCDYQERYQQEVRDKLYSWGAKSDEVEQILCRLIETGYLSEERFACAFARGKFRIKHWGRNKIRQELRIRRITEYCIKQAMAEIQEREYTEVLQQIITKKMHQLGMNVKEMNTLEKRKIAIYAISRGFETNLVWNVLGR